MTHREHDNGFETVPQQRAAHDQGWQDVLTLLIDHGFEGLANAMQILLNEAMKLEREAAAEAAALPADCHTARLRQRLQGQDGRDSPGAALRLSVRKPAARQNSTRRHWNAACASSAL